MSATASSEPRIESYLGHVRVALRGLSAPEIDEILRELRSHIVELTSDGTELQSALGSLGDPVDIAKTYLAESLMVQAECSGSPLVILQGLRHASRSRWGRVLVTALYFFGYINVFTLWAAVIEKLLAPARSGLWYVPGQWSSISLITSGSPPSGARELLGWWLVPIAVLVGWALKVVTDRIAQWWIGRYRRQKDSREV